MSQHGTKELFYLSNDWNYDIIVIGVTHFYALTPPQEEPLYVQVDGQYRYLYKNKIVNGIGLFSFIFTNRVFQVDT